MRRASGAELQLVVSGYTVSYAMLLITGAWLSGLRGRRNLFVAGVAVFTLASAVCGFAPTAPVRGFAPTAAVRGFAPTAAGIRC